MRRRKARWAAGIASFALLLFLVTALFTRETPLDTALPGTSAAPRTLLIVWEVDGVGRAAHAWLNRCASAAEKAISGLTVYIRRVPPEELLREDVVLPDVVFFAGGVLTAPEQLFLPLSGALRSREEFLRSARWQGSVYALPVAVSPWVLAVDASLLPDAVATPAPTTLLGRPAPTAADASPAPSPAPPWCAASLGTVALQDDTGRFALKSLLGASPLPELLRADPLQALLTDRVQAALLDCEDCAALLSAVGSGRHGAVQCYVPPTALAPRVLYAAIPRTANEDAASLFGGFLTGTVCQQLLAEVSLHTVCAGETLYLSGFSAELERSLLRGAVPVNAFLPRAQAEQAARDAWTGAADFDRALASLR